MTVPSIQKNWLGNYVIKHQCACGESLVNKIEDAGRQDTCPVCRCHFIVPCREEAYSFRDPRVSQIKTFKGQYQFPQVVDPGICYFCGQDKSTDCLTIDLYKPVYNGMGGVGWIARFGVAKVEIPRCSFCATVHKVEENNARMLLYGTMFTLPAAIFYLMRHFEFMDKDEPWWTCLLVSCIVSLGLLPILAFPILILFGIIRTLVRGLGVNDNAKAQRNEQDHPLVKALLDNGWQTNKPRAKYDGSLNSDLDSAQIEAAYHEAMAEYKEIARAYRQAKLR